ncbi:MAG TPA: sulfurtransferase [Acidimicrobiales bacterium]|nr:sulfurtransferase [Acidimicrobiales bacterium]
MHPLVAADELATLLDEDRAIAADVRWYLDGRSGRDAYHSGHIPGAVFVDLDTVLAAPVGAGPGRHPLPRPEAFADAMVALAIGDDDLVVAYDDAGGSIAARLWWMLDVTGHRAAVLDGGLGAWTGALEIGDPPPRRHATFTAKEWPASAVADAGDVAALLDRGDGVVLDARASERYRGDVEPIDARAGHIPGARNAPWMGNLAPDGRFLTPADLGARFEAVGVSEETEVIAYCGSGVTACHDVLALRIAGVDARLYEGSWSDWSSDPVQPVATGDEPG